MKLVNNALNKGNSKILLQSLLVCNISTSAPIIFLYSVPTLRLMLRPTKVTKLIQDICHPTGFSHKSSHTNVATRFQQPIFGHLGNDVIKI